MKRTKRFFSGIMAFVVIIAVLVSPVTEYLPIIGERMKVSAAGGHHGWTNPGSGYGYSRCADNDAALAEVKALMQKTCSASEMARFEKILSEFPLEGYFNTTAGPDANGKLQGAGRACSGHDKDRKNFYDDETGTTITNNFTAYGDAPTTFTNAKQCAGFAIYCYYRFYGKLVAEKSINFKNGYSASDLKNALENNNIRAGAHFRWFKDNSSSQHSLVYLTHDDKYMYFIDANFACTKSDASTSNCKIHLKKITYAEFKEHYPTYFYIYYSETSKFDSGSTDNVTITNTTSKNTITDTNAILWAQVDKPKSYKVTKIGVRVRVNGGTYDNGWSKYDNTSKTYTDSTYMYMYYDMNKELNLKLTPGTTYYYQFYAVVNGKEYWGTESKFTTTNSVAIKNTSSKNTITDTNAIIWAQVDKPKSYSVTKIGVRVRIDGDTYANGWSKYDKTSKNYTDLTYMYMYYDMNKELNLKLTHATTYYYQFYAVVNGQEYWGPEGKFTTTGSHSYGSWKTTKEATCTESGTQTRTCSCGAKETKTIAALGHNWSTTWSKDSSSHWHVCTRCNTTGDKASHSWDSGTVTKQPTCTVKGEKTYICTVCKATKTESVAALGHSWSTAWSKDGSSHWHVCTRCNTTGDKASHSWDSGTVTKQPTCTAKGEKTYTCTVCKATKTESVAALGHSWSTAWSKDDTSHWHICTRCDSTDDKAAHSFKEQVIPPSGSSQGYTQHTCTICSYSYQDNYTSANTVCSHKNTKEVITNATCDKDGRTETVCKNCGETLSAKTIPATGAHAWDKGKETQKATCTKSGVITYTCTVCGNTKTDMAAALGHSFGVWEVTKEATVDQEGQRSRVCELCRETETETVPMLVQSVENETITTTPKPDSEDIETGDGNGDNNPVDEDPGTGGNILLVDEASKIELLIASGIITDEVQLRVVVDSENQTDTRIAYDIALVDADGNRIQPEGSVTVRIPVPAEWTTQNMCIYRAEDDGTYTDMKMDYDGGYAVFTTDHFSTYVLMASAQGGNLVGDRHENNGDISENGENNSSVLIYVFISVIVVLAAAVAVMSVLMVRKRR